jgi:penicillin-binding protein 2
MLTPGAFEDRRSLLTRLTVLRAGAVVGFTLLAVTFWTLQVAQHAKYSEWADNNFMRQIPLRAPRGVLFDRGGRVLVENRDSFTISIIRERTTDLDAAVTEIARVTGEDEQRIREVVQRHKREASFRPIPVIEHATFAQVAAVRARQLELPGVDVQVVPARAYPEGGMGAHLFGYVSEIQESQLERPEYAGLEAGAIVGQSGVERVYNASLQGTDGRRNVVINSVGREIHELAIENPVEGKRLQLTIDYDLQRALEEGFRAGGYAGAAAFLDPRTGEVLAMTSLPAYDPNDFAVGIAGAKWAELNKDPLRPLENRLMRGRYSPGSTFKIVMSIAALSEGVITPDFKVFCPGSKTFYGRTWQCNRRGGHGVVDLRHAIEQSCNVYFYTVGDLLKIDTIHDYAAKLGLVGTTGIDLPGELSSLVPSTEWKQKTFNQPWYPGETISVAIGQGAVSVTPLALATMISTVANGGTLVTPHVVRAMDEAGRGWQLVPTPPSRSEFRMRPDVLQAVRDGLWMVVNAAGTGGRARIEGKDVSGKTGTAQVISLEGARVAKGKMDVRDHGFFVFFAPRDNPQIAGIVFAEHGVHGSSAAPIAKYVMETFFAKQDGKPLPAWPKPIVAPPAPTDPRPRAAAAEVRTSNFEVRSSSRERRP